MIMNRFAGMAGIVMAATFISGPAFAGGQEVYTKSCAMCHDTGVAGAPRVGDDAAWSARTAGGMDAVYEHAINGFQGETGMMPPKGGNSGLSDEDVKAAVDYMVGATK